MIKAVRANRLIRTLYVPVSVGALSLLAVAGPAGAQQRDYALPTFQADLGGVGLLQTPTARMAPLGRLSFTLDQIDPYTNYAFSVQPFDWLEAGFRYTQVGNRDYAASDEGLDYLDKGVDVKLSLIDESRFRPAVAVGFRDLGGTGLFGSEYFVANKRWYNLDFSLGIGWGYLGSRGDLSSPFGVFGSSFDERGQAASSIDDTGDFNLKQLFSGDAALFGGIQYQTPFQPLTLQIEYEGNDYQSEPLNNPQEQDSPVNLGLRYQLGDNVVLSASWERGNTAMLGATFQLDLAGISQVKNDPIPVAPQPTRDNATRDWPGVAKQLSSNAGIAVSKIARRGDTLIVEGSPSRYRNMPEAELRANRILHNAASADIQEFRYRWTMAGLTLREDALPRDPLPEAPLLVSPASTFADEDYRYGVTTRAAASDEYETAENESLYQTLGDRFSWSLAPDINQNYGGPDGYLYKILAKLNTEFKTDAHGWFSSTLGYTVYDNLDKFSFTGPSELPRVRTYIGQYLDQTDLGIYNLQYTRTARISDNWFGMAYAGLLEQMYGGAGAEVLYRPFDSAIAFGLDANWVRQRAFDTQFDFRDYSTWTGNATLYWDTGIKDVLAQVSVGRYLAKDIGTTIDLSREFDSGVRIGAFATFTDAGNKFGEGSFDKGIYVSLPLDLFFTNSTRGRASATWRPLTRDGGAKLYRRYSLYGLTEQRSLGDYWENYEGAFR